MIRVIIADDHRIFRQGFAALLAEEPGMELVGEVDSGKEALRLIRELRPNVAVLDVSMPRPDGIEIAEQLRKEGVDVPCLILTMHDDAVTMQRAMNAGARGYVVKNDAFEEFVAAVRNVASGRTFFYSSFAPDGPAATIAAPLTAREQEILHLVAQGLASKAIAAHLNLSQRTVENHRQNIMKKLNIRSATALVCYATKQRVR